MAKADPAKPARAKAPPAPKKAGAQKAALKKAAPKKAAKPPKAKKPFRLGLAARVALIGCGAAVAATLAQWIITPILIRNSFERARLQYSHNAAAQLAGLARFEIEDNDPAGLREVVKQMGDPLPGGAAAILGADGRVLAATANAAPIAREVELQVLHDGEGAVKRGDNLVGFHPIRRDGHTVGFAVISMAPRTLASTWLGVLLAEALVLVLAIAVLAPFLLPLARKALSPVTRLEQRIRKRAAQDKSRLADGVDDTVLAPLLGAIDEVHERSEAATRRALKMAFADPVTRLPNRLRFMAKLDGLVERAGEKPVHLALVDLDAFRKINVEYGPRLADEVLARVAERLRTCAADSTVTFLGRIGADQFGVIAPAEDGDKEKLIAFLGAAERAIAEAMVVEHQHIRVTAAFGVAVAPADAQTGHDLLKQAELALKEAKRLPAMRRAFFDLRLLQKAREQSKLEAELREGLDKNQFVAVFQPKVKLETGELVGAEALARWRRPDGSVVSPGVFVPIAEEMGLIGKLGNAVMRDACFAAAAWNKHGPEQRIAVNVSPHQFNDADFINQVYQALDDSGLDPRLLELEITESAAVLDPDRVARIMWPLRNRGVRLAIDDFGTGHSNFASITRLPFDVFKIDQQFIRALTTDPHAPAIIEMILAMAEALGQETVAEGVETREQADFLLRRNCTIGQGYYFSPPLPAHEFDMFVKSWRPRPANRFAAA